MAKLSKNFPAARCALFLLTAALPAMVLTQGALAQQITSGIRGVVTGPDGTPVIGARVVVTDSRTNRTTSTMTGNGGLFAVGGLEVGGPYTVLIDTEQYNDQRVEGVFLSVSDIASLDISLTESTEIDEIVVTAAARVTSKLSIGPSSAFGLETLENLPSIQRDIRDVIRIDPRVTIDDNNEDGIKCLGGNNRTNAFTIDGVRAADAFGLNQSGLPSRNALPIPFDSIRETSVEFAPYDVEFGQFRGCNINVVTKSGSNEFHGSAFAVMNGDGITGKKLEGDEVRSDEFRDWNWGSELSGPIIKDKLFLYFAYEQAEEQDTQDRGPIGGGFANEEFLTIGDAQRIQDVLLSRFGRDTLGLARGLDNTNRRFLIRGDWFITDEHRLAFTYTRLREGEVQADDFGRFPGVAFRDNFDIEGSNIKTYSARLFSDWSENFSTEIRFSRVDKTDLQDPVGGGEAQSGNPKPRIVVQDGARRDIAISGPGFFRSANAGANQIDQLKVAGTYRAAAHTVTAGYELDQLDVFNLFVPDATGTITFASVADLEAGKASRITAANTFTGDINDAAARFSRSVHTLYVQDKWQATRDLELTFGLRYDFFVSDDNPPLNERFVDRYGFANTQAFDDLDILMPRFRFNYDAPWDFFGHTTLRGGAGLFSGGDPTVWFANSFQNFGFAIGTTNSAAAGCTTEELQVIDSTGAFSGVPQCVLLAAQQQALNNNGPVAAIDPDLKMPAVIRSSFGFTHFTDFGGAAGGFFDDWEINMDVIHSRLRNPFDAVDLTLTPVGFAPDGRPIFNRIDPSLGGCNAVFLGPRRGFSGNTEEGGLCEAALSGRGSIQDILLTNAVGPDKGGQVTFSTQFAKDFTYDLFNRPGRFNLNFGYAFTKSKEINPFSRFTPDENVEEVALSVVNAPPLANSPFVNRHNVTMAAIFENDWWHDYTTTFGFFFQAREGEPFSFTFGDSTATTVFGDTDREARQLLYVPTGPNDPLVDFSRLSQADIDAFFAFIDKAGLDKFAGQIAPRNEFRDPWFTDLDMRFAQEFPGFSRNDRFEFSLDIDNLLNLINSDANILKKFDRGDVGEAVPLVDAVLSPDGQRFVFTRATSGLAGTNAGSGGGGDRERVVDASIWRVQIGLRYKF